MKVVLISTYELGHQPFGLASPAAWLKEAGADVVSLDLSLQTLDPAAVTGAGLIAFYAPMHTATRLAASIIPQVRQMNPTAHLCCYGLYAPVNEAYLRGLGIETILGGEFETGLVALYDRLATETVDASPDSRQVATISATISLERQRFRQPDRNELPPLTRYAWLEMGDGQRRTVGYTEASRGCKHQCRHCPIVPVYNGRFRIVQPEVVLADIRQQVEAGAEHITFGDPDFLNGPGHAIPLVEALHEAFPGLTYDVTIKIEHLRQHQRYLPVLRDTGCLFVTSAIEAVDDEILARFDKGHTRADFIHVVALLREVGLTLNPTFVTFTPWTSLAGYLDFLQLIRSLDLVEHMAPIQYAIRLLIPAGSKLLELSEVAALVEPFDEAALVYPWQHPDPAVDQLYELIFRLVKRQQQLGESRTVFFQKVWDVAEAVSQRAPDRATASIAGHLAATSQAVTAEPIPHLSEDWY